MLIHVALVSQTNAVGMGQLLQVSAALQKQVSRDFSPIWNVNATVDPFEKLDDVPVGYWPVIVVDQVATGELGTHGQRDNQPMAFVGFKDEWSLTASHEVLEMLADPYSNRLVAGDSVADSTRRVEYLVEVSDPCQDATFGYRVNGILVSDFYTPQYFDAVGTTGARYDFTGAISQPRTVLEGGYLSWRDPETNHLHRADMINSELFLSDLGNVPTTGVSLRSHVDSIALPPKSKRVLLKRSPSRLKGRNNHASNHAVASVAKAKHLKSQWKTLSKRFSGV